MPTHDNTHGCPIPGCSFRQLPVGLLMCYNHWPLVPRPLQQEVYYAWNRGNPRPGYLLARQAAINAVIAAVGVR